MYAIYLSYLSHCVGQKSKILVSQSIHIQCFFSHLYQGVEDAGAGDPDSAAGHVGFCIGIKKKSGKSRKNDEK